jgi:MFS family permease
MVHMNLVLALLIKDLGGSNVMVGLLPGISMGVMRIPQLYVAGRLRNRQRKMPFYLWSQLGRVVGYALIAVLIAAVAVRTPGVALGVFMVTFAVSRLVMGVGSIAWMDVLGKAIPTEAMGRFWAQRSLWGRVAGVAGSFTAGGVLAGRVGLGFPYNYALLFAMASVLCGLGAVSFSRIPEPLQPVPERASGMGEQLTRVPRILRQEENFRRYLLARLLFLGGGLAAPFYAIFAREVLEAPASVVGTYLPALTVSGVVSTLAWGRVADRKGVHSVLQWAAVVRLASPVLALGLPALFFSAGWDPGAVASGLVLVFILQGASLSGQMVGANSYLLLLAPERSRPIYVGLTNTLLALGSVLPIFGGFISEWFGYEAVFSLAALAMILASFQAWKLECVEPVE